MWVDPIVKEVHDARRKLLDKYGGDLGKLVDYLRHEQAKHPERVVTIEQLKERRAGRSEPVTR